MNAKKMLCLVAFAAAIALSLWFDGAKTYAASGDCSIGCGHVTRQRCGLEDEGGLTWGDVPAAYRCGDHDEEPPGYIKWTPPGMIYPIIIPVWNVDCYGLCEGNFGTCPDTTGDAVAGTSPDYWFRSFQCPKPEIDYQCLQIGASCYCNTSGNNPDSCGTYEALDGTCG
jgi:hypothetical protein